MKTLGDQNNEDIGEDQLGVETVQEIRMFHPQERQIHRITAHEDKRDQQHERNRLFRGDKAEQIHVAAILFAPLLDLVIDPQEDENQQRAETAGQDMQHLVLVAQIGERLGKIRQFLEGVPDEDQGENFELLAQRPGKGTGQDKDQADHLQDEDDGEGRMDRKKMVYRHQRRQVCGQKALPVQFNSGQTAQEQKNQPN